MFKVPKIDNLNHIPEHCKKPTAKRRSAIMRYFLRWELLDDLYANNICVICRKTLTTNHEEAKCLMNIAISTNKGFGVL